MNISDPVQATMEISGNFGILIGMIVAALVIIVIIWIFTQFRGR